MSGTALAWLEELFTYPALQAGNDNLCLTDDQPDG